MNLTIFLITLAVVAVAVIRNAARGISAEAARDLLNRGAMLVDVRTAEEFQSRRLPGTVNIPLDRIAREVPRRVPDKGRALLLHCRSGARSARAMKQLRALGYRNVFNLGSFERARRVMGRPPRLMASAGGAREMP